MAADAAAATGLLRFWALYGSAITGGAVIVSALCAITVILANRTIARKRATLDLILHIESDGDLIDARNKMIDLKKSTNRSGVYGTEDKRDSDEAKAIRTTLNIDELVAVQIVEGVIDERVYRRWFNKAFIDDYKSMTGYIEAVREYKKNPNVFRELELLAKRWEDDVAWYQHPGWFRRKMNALKLAWRA